MNRCALLVGAMVMLFLGSTLSSQARIRSMGDLSRQDKIAFFESRVRLIADDHALQVLEIAHGRHTISAKFYTKRSAELFGHIVYESTFQDAILARTPTFHFKLGSEILASTDKIWDDYGHYVIEVPAYIAVQALAGLGRSGVSVSP